MKDRLIELLGDGVPQAAAAEAVGVTPARISQMLSEDPVFSEAVNTRRLARLTRYSQIDNKYDELELKALKRLENSMALLPLSKPDQIVRVINTLNSARRKSQVSQQEAHTQVALQVNVAMPEFLVNRYFKVNQDKNQVIEVDGKPLITASPEKLNDKRTTETVKREVDSSRSEPELEDII